MFRTTLLALLVATPATAGIVYPDDCARHPTPPPQRYVDDAIELQQLGLTVVTLRVLPAAEVHHACGGGASPVGYPGRRFGACTQMDLGGLPIRATIIVPQGGVGAVCHELGHLGGWPGDHSRR